MLNPNLTLSRSALVLNIIHDNLRYKKWDIIFNMSFTDAVSKYDIYSVNMDNQYLLLKSEFVKFQILGITFPQPRAQGPSADTKCSQPA